MRGIVVKYNPEKGYGFIRSPECHEDLFVHISEVRNVPFLVEGQKVDFLMKETPKGLAALNVIAGRKVLPPRFTFGMLALGSVLLLMLLFYWMHPLIGYFIAINLTTFLLYGYDKKISSTEKVRVPERTLHKLALLGGSPAGLLAQRFFRHKTLKGSFQMIYWVIVLVQVGLISFVIQQASL